MVERKPRDRRGGHAGFHVPERRSGFDRRSPRDPLRLLLDRPLALVVLLVSLNLLSLADWALTWRALAYGAREANTVIGSLMAVSPLAALVFKVGSMLLVTALIWRNRRYRLVLATAIFAVGGYAVLMLYHGVGLASVGGL
jgi:hypothetical protein